MKLRGWADASMRMNVAVLAVLIQNVLSRK